MEGPFDPQPPDHDADAPADGQDDLHALLERLLGQGDARPAESGAGDELWPDLFPAPTVPDEVSTIVPAADTPAAPVAAVPATGDAAPGDASDLPPARPWEAVVVDAPAPAGADDVQAAILASVSVDLEPIAPVAAAPDAVMTEAVPAPAVEADATTPEAVAMAADAFTPDEAAPDLAGIVAELSAFAPAADEPMVPGDAVETIELDAVQLDAVQLDAVPLDAVPLDPALFEPLALEPVQLEPADLEPASVEPAFLEPVGFEPVAFEPTPVEPPAAADGGGDPFILTPFEAAHETQAEELSLDTEALWAAALPELGLDVAPQLDLDGDDEPAGPTAVVLPWPTQEPKAVEPAAPADLIEAALSGLHADLTAEPVEPLRTPDVAASTAHVVFRLGARVMAIPLGAVSEIGRPPKITRLPHVPAWVLGIANLRGDIVSMLDLEGFFSGKAGRASQEQRMLALRPVGEEVRTAVLVDSVDGIQALEDARVGRVTRGYDAEVAPYARGLYQMGDDLVVVVDADRLLQSKPMRQFEDGAGAR